MTREEAYDYLMFHENWNTWGVDVITNQFSDEELAVMTTEDLKRASDEWRSEQEEGRQIV